jgi:CHAT domain-containing protein
LAGAREVLVALWPVSDQSTPAFMERFYQLALASDHPAQALWQAQREFLTAPGSEDDFESAFLRFGPFAISQNTPLAATAATITAQPPRSWRTWKSLLFAIPLVVFLVARFSQKRKPA